MLSPLSRGYGTWSGEVEYNQPKGPSRENTFPSIGDRNLTGISLSATIRTKSAAPTAPLEPPQPSTREPSYGEMYLPKTYLTRKGALLLFTAPESELDDNDFDTRWHRQRLYKMRRARVAKLIDLSLRLGNLTRLSNSVLQYGNQDYDHENASISDEKNKEFLKFLQNMDQKEVDTHAKPGGDLEFYLRDLKSRGRWKSSFKFMTKVQEEAFKPKHSLSILGYKLDPTANCIDPDLPLHHATEDQGLCSLQGIISRTNNINPGLLVHHVMAEQGLCCLQLDRLLSKYIGARYVVSGDTYLPKSRISQELQAILHGLDANCPPSFSQEPSSLGERSHSRLSDQFTRPVSRASSRAQSPGSAPPSTPKSYNVLSSKKLTASIKSCNYLGRPSSTEPLQDDPQVRDAIGVGISPAEEGTDVSGLDEYTSPLNRKLFRMPGTQPSVAGSSIAEEEENLDHLSRTLKERATSPGMPIIFQGREVKGCRGEGKGDGEGQDLHKGEVDKFEFEDRRVIEVKYSQPGDVINEFIESDPLDEFFEDEQEITEVTTEISQKKLSKEDMTVAEDDSIHISETDRSETVDHSDVHIVKEHSDHEAEEQDDVHRVKEQIDNLPEETVSNGYFSNHRVKEQIDNLPEETVSNGYFSNKNEVEEEQCTETHSMSEKLSQKEDDKMSMISGQTDLTSEKASVKVTGVSHVEIKVIDKVAGVTNDEVDSKAESDLEIGEIDKSNKVVTDQTYNQQEVEVLVMKEKEEEVVVVGDWEHMRIGEVTGEESEDEDKVDEILLERFRRGGSLISLQSEEVLAQYPETKPPPLERDNIERQHEDIIPKIEIKVEEVKRPRSAKSKASISSRSSSGSRPTSARQKAQRVPSRPSSAINTNLACKLEAEELMNQSMDMVSKELVETECTYEAFEENIEDAQADTQKPLMSDTQVASIHDEEIDDERRDAKIIEEENTANEIIEAPNDSLKAQNVHRKTLIENEIECLSENHEVSSQSEVASMKITEGDTKAVSIENEQTSQQNILETMIDQDVNSKTLSDKTMLDVIENKFDHQKYSPEIPRTEEPVKESKMNYMDQNITDLKLGKMQQPPSSKPIKTESHSTLAKITAKPQEDKKADIKKPVVASPMKSNDAKSKTNLKVKMDQNITDPKLGKMQQLPSSEPNQTENHSTLAKITAKPQDEKSDIRKPVVASPMKSNDAKYKTNLKVKMDSHSSILKPMETTQVHKKDEANHLDEASKQQLETETDVSSRSELSHLTQLAQSIGGKVPKVSGKGKKRMGMKGRQKSSTSLDKTDTISETTSSVGSKRRDSLKIPEHMKDALSHRPSLSNEELEKELERMSEMVDATLSGPTLHNIGEGLTEEELELAKQILQGKLAAAKEKIEDPKGQGKKSPSSKSASSRKSKKKDDKSDIEKEQDAIREKHDREKKNREEEVRALQQKIAERKTLLKQQKDLSDAKTKELQEEMDRLQQEADEIQRTEDDVRAQLAEIKRKQREERQARKNEMLEKKKQEIAARRERERKEAEEKRKKEQEMHEKIADAEMRRRLREEEEINRAEEERLAEERYLKEIKEQQRLAEEEEERARELERQAEEEAMQRLIEERNEAERQRRLLMEEKMRMEEESLREQELELERQRQLEEEERKRLEEEQAIKDQEMARIAELRMMEEKAKTDMQIALEKKRTEAVLRRDKNLEARQNILQLRHRQAITRAWVFSYFIRWPRETYEQPIGGKPKTKQRPRAKTPKPDAGVQKPS